MTDPHDGDYTVVHDPGMGQSFTGAHADYLAAGEGYRWPNPINPIDSHEVGFEHIEPLGGHVDGPVPPNIHTEGGPWGPGIPAS